MARRNRGRRPRGFTGPGWRELSNVALPLKGRDKRMFFNKVSDWAVVAAGLIAAIVGYAVAGPIGSAVGLAVGLPAAARAMVRWRFRRG